MAVLSQVSLVSSYAPTIILLLLVVLGAYLRYKNAKYRYPPGPAALPLLGNVHQLPKEYQPVTLAEWGKKYGNLFPNVVIDRWLTIVLQVTSSSRDSSVHLPSF